MVEILKTVVKQTDSANKLIKSKNLALIKSTPKDNGTEPLTIRLPVSAKEDLRDTHVLVDDPDSSSESTEPFIMVNKQHNDIFSNR